MAQPFDPQTLQPAGDLFPVAEHVSRVNLSGAMASISGNGALVYWGGVGFGLNQLVWYDRSGKPTGNVGAPARALEFALSPDEKTVASARRTGSGNFSDIWLHELARGVETRFTFQASANGWLVWSPDGRRIAFASSRTGALNLYLKDTSGAGQDEELLKPGTLRVPCDWSRDGQFLLYTDGSPKTASDLWVLNMEGDRKPVPFLQTPFFESQGQFSPDGHWIAYASDESGRFEVYVRPFPSGPAKWKISINGGEHPRWRGDGKEIFYLSPDRKLMAAAVNGKAASQPVFEAQGPVALFEAHIPSLN